MHSANVLDLQQGSSLSPFVHPSGGANYSQSGTNLVNKESTTRAKIPTQFSNGQNNQKVEGQAFFPKTPEAVRQGKVASQELTSLGRLSGIMRYTPNGLEKYIGSITPRKSAQDLSNIQKKKKKSGFYQAIKLRKLAIKWMNMAGFMRYKKLIFSQFNLIDDKSIIYSQQNLPNRIGQSGISTKGKGVRIIRKLLCCMRKNDSKDKMTDKAGQLEHGYEQKLKEQLFLNNLLWLDEFLRFLPVISPTGNFKFLWDILVLVAIISFMFMIPLEFTFSLGLEEMFNVDYLRVCVSILIADFILSWNFGYFEKGLPITIRSHVIHNYLKKGLIIDVGAIFFLSIDILFRYKEQSNSYLHLLFILKINSIKVIFKKIEERFHLTPQITQISSLIKLLFLILTVAHILGCTWVIVAHKEIDSGQSSWIQKVAYDPTDWFAQYQCAYYFSTVTMITVGYGDFAPVNNVERMVDIVAMLISCGVFAYSINAIGEIFAVINLKKNKIKNDLFAISNFMSKKSINQQLQYEVREFLEFQWKISSDRDHQKEAALINQLSGSLREKLLVETYKLVLTQYKIFSQNFSEEFMISLIDIIEEHTIRPDEIIISELGEQQSDLFFVENGKIIIYADENGEKIIKIYSKGDAFGEIAFFTGQPNALNIKAVEHSILLCINRKKFISLIQNFPIDYEVFCNMKDSLIYQNDYSQICLKCFSCGSGTHTIGQCPSIHLVLNNVQVINRMIKQEFGERRSMERISKKFPSLILLEYVERQAVKFMNANTEDIYNYIELYFENEEELERPQSNRVINEQEEEISPYLGPKESLQICEIAQDAQNNYETTSNSLIDASPTVQQSALKEAGLSGLGLLDQLTHASMQNHLNSVSISQGHGEMKNRVNSKEFPKINSSISPFFGLSDLDINYETRQKKSMSSQSAVGKLAFSQISSKTSNLNTVQASSPLRKKDKSLISQVSMPQQAAIQTRFDKSGSPQIFPNLPVETTNQKSLFQQATKNLNNLNNSLINNVNGIQQSDGQPDSAISSARPNVQYPSNTQGNNSIFHKRGRNQTQVLNKAKMQVLVDEIAKVVAQNRDQEVNHQNADAEEEFDKQRNYNFYMPHNNLSTVLEYIRFRQKNIKSTKASARFISNSKNNIFESNRKLTAVSMNISQNPQNFSLIRRFEQTNLPSIQEKKRRETFINKKRRSKKLATTHIQKLVLKYEEISNQVLQNPDSSSDIVTPSNRNLNQGDNKEQSSSSNESIVQDLAQKIHLDEPIPKEHQQALHIFQFPPEHQEDMFSSEQMAEEQAHDTKTLSCYQHLQSYITRKDRFLGNTSQRIAQNDYCSREEVWGNQDTAQHHSFIKSAFDPEANLQPEFQFSSIKFLQQEDINSSSSSIPSTSRNILPLEAILPKLANKNYKCEELSPFQSSSAIITTQQNCDSKNAKSLTFKQHTEHLEDSQFL